MMPVLRLFPFLLLFPGLFGYHWAARNGLIPLLLGGYVNEVSAAICVGAILAWVMEVLIFKRILMRWTYIDTCFVLFMTWFAVVVLFHIIQATAPGVTKSHIAGWLQLLAYYITARHMSLKTLQPLLLVLVCVFSATVFWAAQSDLLALLLTSSDERHAATYQDLARTFLISAAFGLVSVRGPSIRYVGYIVTLLVLFLLGARSEMAGALVLYVVIEVVLSPRPLRAAIVIFFGAALGLVALVGNIDAMLAHLPDNRLLILVMDFGADGSVQERSIYQEFAWNTIQDSPFVGDYGHYEKEFSAGAYAHNWVSVWVDLGLLGLFLFLLIYIAIARQLISIFFLKQKNKESMDSTVALALGLLALSLMFAVFAKPFSDPLLALLAGFTVRFNNNYVACNSFGVDRGSDIV